MHLTLGDFECRERERQNPFMNFLTCFDTYFYEMRQENVVRKWLKIAWLRKKAFAMPSIDLAVNHRL